MVQAQPDATLVQYCDQWEPATGMRVSIQTMSRVLIRLDWPRKKRLSAHGSETKVLARNGESKPKPSQREK